MGEIRAYRKRSVTVEATQWDGTKDDAERVLTWMRGHGQECQFISIPGMTCSISIVTLEGVMYALQHDWVIRGVAGEFYPCKPAIFEETYEPV